MRQWRQAGTDTSSGPCQRCLAPVLLLFLLALNTGTARLRGSESAAPRPPRYVPSETRVAVLPFINLTGEKIQEALDDVEGVDHAVAGLLLQRGFAVIGDKEVLEAMAELRIPVHDRAERTPDALRRLAERLGARIVVWGLVVDKRSTADFSLLSYAFGPLGQWWTSPKGGTASLWTQVWDSADVAPVDQGSSTAEAEPPELSLGGRSHPLRTRAMQSAALASVQEFLQPYPVVVSSVDVSQRSAYRRAMAEALTAPVTHWVPAATTVLVLPFLDELAKRDANSAALALDASRHAADEFASRGFHVLSGESAASAASAAGLDIASPGARSREVLQAVGEAAHADVVVTGSVLLSVPSLAKVSFGRSPWWMVKTEIRVLDVREGRYLCIAAGSAQSTLPPGSTTRRKRAQALAHAVANGLKDLLAPYHK